MCRLTRVIVTLFPNATKVIFNKAVLFIGHATVITVE